MDLRALCSVVVREPGKTILRAAIGNHLLAGGHSVLVVTIPDLMLRVRECYDGGQSEASLLDDLCKVDLLVLDGSRYSAREQW
ncbi:DNA replication protein DnaC [Salmonella enterica subsp. enterica]|uniref:DNA replication protein DnaC n=1 Tax=Salmonella enterica I TaxID=59201 RepID=A0A379VTR8_SALET|nr:DNA replication protein DnaC [Salmonella enterica subsp. enterica]